jgi:hypothetical protein
VPEAVVVQQPASTAQAQLPLEPQTPEVIAPSGRRRFEIPDEQVVDVPETPAASTPEVKSEAQNTGEEATPAKPEGEKPEEVTPEQAAKREGRRFERRLDKAYRKAAEAQARAELLEKQLAELKQPKAPEGAPTLEQFDYDPEKYAAAKADYAKAEAAKEYEAKQKTEAGKQATQKLLTDWEEKAERGADKYDDWTEIVGELKPTNPFMHAIMEAENGEDVAHYLGKHPKEAERIAKLPPLSQVREVGKLEAKLLAKPAEPKTPSKAPAPITPLTGAAPVVSDAPSETDDIRDWIRKRQKQVHGRR